jgi:hypothetical protein
MTRTLVQTTILAASLAAVPALSYAQQPAQAAAAPAAPGAVTAADAKPFLGDWSVAGESPMGPFIVNVSVKVADGKVVGEISSDIQAPTPVNDVTKTGNNLILRYSFSYEGNDIPAVLTLTPKEDKLDAFFSFADGAFEMGGVGTKKAA